MSAFGSVPKKTTWPAVVEPVAQPTALLRSQLSVWLHNGRKIVSVRRELTETHRKRAENAKNAWNGHVGSRMNSSTQA